MINSILIICLSVILIHGQDIDIKGNLLRVSADQPVVDYSDTLGEWYHFENEYGYSNSEYYETAHSGSHNYLISEWYHYHEFTDPGSSANIIESADSGEKTVFSSSGWDIFLAYGIDSRIIEIPSGTWLFDDFEGQGFLSKSDSLTVFPYGYGPLIHIIGIVDSLYLSVVQADDYFYAPYRFFLLDLASSPNIDTTNATQLFFDSNHRPIRVQNILPDYYLVEEHNCTTLYLYHYENHVFNIVKPILEISYQNRWIYKDGYLYRKLNNELIRYTFISADTSFVDETVILNGEFNVDKNFDYAAHIINDSTLNLLRVSDNFEINCWDISNLYKPSRPLIDYPYIYIHAQQKEDTLAIGQDLINLPNEFDLKAYPNPFNARVTVSFHLQNPDHVKLILYDLNGRKYTPISESFLHAGLHKFSVDMTRFSSGIYFIRLESNRNFEVVKIVSLK